MWIWLLSIFLVIATWVVGFFLAWPLWLKILLTVLSALLVAGWLVGRRVRASMKARALERDLLRQAEQQALNARPDRRAEILELQVQVQNGLAALKRSKLGSGGGASALYTLPWYMIIGPPGAGKTTALKRSGLVFPFLDPRSGGGLRGVGGTRNCDWWFTNEAILLDTAGRYATEADDHDEWLAFVDMLRKYRSKKPINGVLVAISVTDLIEATDEQIDSFAKRLRARIDEITTRLHMVVPVYVTFTKVDLIAGFNEFFSDLRKSERAQIFGMTFPLDGNDKRDVGRAFDEEYDLIVDSLHARALRRVAGERQLDVRQRVYQFPLEFAALRQNLHDFVAALFQQNNFQETPILRGAYFTSGTQEGRPIDRVIGGMMRAFNLPAPEAGSAQPQTESKSYFVTDLFRRVVFPDQNVASRTRGELRRQMISRVAFAACAFLMAALLILPSTYTFAQNLDLVHDSAGLAGQAQKVNWRDGDPQIAGKAHKLDALEERLDDLDKWRVEHPPLRLRWGMYVGEDLYEPLRSVYVNQLQVGFAQPTQAELEGELAAISAGGGRLSVDQYSTYFIRLKTYLEMSDPTHFEADWEKAPLVDAWSRALATSAPADKAALAPHVEHYLALVQRQEVPPWKADMNLVNRVRSVLRQTSEADRDYSVLIRDANENLAPITRASIFIDTNFGAFVASKAKQDVVVRGAFTRLGWENYVRARLDPDRAKELAGDRWVLGESDQRGLQEITKQLAELRDRYFAEYRNAWRDFLANLDVRQPVSNSEALDEFQALSEAPWPYFKLLKTLDDNTHLEQPTTAGSLAETAGATVIERIEQNTTVQKYLGDAGPDVSKKRWVSPVEEAFKPMTTFGVPPGTKGDEKPPPTGLSHYEEQIVAKLVGVLTDLKDSKAPPDSKSVQEAFGEAFRGTTEILTATQSGFTRPLLSPLLMNPIRLGFAGVLGDVAGAAGAKWEIEVWSKWHAKLENKYPFTDSPQDATVSDFSEFFKPDKGLIWAFYDQNLKSSLERNGDTFTPVTRFQHAIRYTGDFLQCYDRGAQITGGTFPPGAEKPLVEFDLNLHSVSEAVSEVTLQIDGATRTYKNTPQEWLHAQWPAKEPKEKGAMVRVRGFSSLDEEITRPGDFGLFRLFDAATSVEPGTEGGRPDGAPTLVMTWNLRSQKGWIRMDVRPSGAASAVSSYIGPKHERLFRNYRCPRVVAAGVN